MHDEHHLMLMQMAIVSTCMASLLRCNNCSFQSSSRQQMMDQMSRPHEIAVSTTNTISTSPTAQPLTQHPHSDPGRWGDGTTRWVLGPCVVNVHVVLLADGAVHKGKDVHQHMAEAQEQDCQADPGKCEPVMWRCMGMARHAGLHVPIALTFHKRQRPMLPMPAQHT